MYDDDDYSPGIAKALLIIVGTGAFFSLVWATPGGWDGARIGFLLGAYVGFAMLPAWDEHKYKPRPVSCAILGAIGAMGFMTFFEEEWSFFVYAFSAFIGGIIGFFAPIWVKYLR